MWFLRFGGGGPKYVKVLRIWPWNYTFSTILIIESKNEYTKSMQFILSLYIYLSKENKGYMYFSNKWDSKYIKKYFYLKSKTVSNCICRPSSVKMQSNYFINFYQISKISKQFKISCHKRKLYCLIVVSHHNVLLPKFFSN